MAYSSKKKGRGPRASLKDIEDALGERVGAQVNVSIRKDPGGDSYDYVYVVQQKLHGKLILETSGETLDEALSDLANMIVR